MRSEKRLEETIYISKLPRQRQSHRQWLCWMNVTIRDAANRLAR